ncbi:hypothetical protein [Scytonema sp. UIC 10036]|uniref:hypothetical protein n=1 Tax=Scytonema sp. UIC 10036 TaxID=2304196 RepID=UPI001FAA2AF9|nr:hypothetical protein [Scytonema sp. UIC 10036]
MTVDVGIHPEDRQQVIADWYAVSSKGRNTKGNFASSPLAVLSVGYLCLHLQCFLMKTGHRFVVG